MENREFNYIDYDTLQGDIFIENVIPVFTNNMKKIRKNLVCKVTLKYDIENVQWGRESDENKKKELNDRVDQLKLEIQSTDDDLYSFIKFINCLQLINKNISTKIEKNETFMEEHAQCLLFRSGCYDILQNRYNSIKSRNSIIRSMQIKIQKENFSDKTSRDSASHKDLCLYQIPLSSQEKLSKKLYKKLLLNSFASNEKYKTLEEEQEIKVPFLDIETSCKSKKTRMYTIPFSLVNFSTNDFKVIVKITIDGDIRRYVTEENKQDFFNEAYEWINNHKNNNSITVWFSDCEDVYLAKELFNFIQKKFGSDVEMCF